MSSTLPILTALVLLPPLIACARSGEATTRKEQEAKFKIAFGFAPPAAVSEIRYADLSNRGAVDAAYAEWLRFTYEETSVRSLLSRNGFTQVQGHLLSFPNQDAAPEWFDLPTSLNGNVYSRTHDDTPAREGFSFEELIFHSPETGFVYYHKHYWD